MGDLRGIPVSTLNTDLVTVKTRLHRISYDTDLMDVFVQVQELLTYPGPVLIRFVVKPYLFPC